MPKKVALLFVCVNPLYWPFLKDVITDCKQKFLPGHKVDYFIWSDMPELGEELDTLLKTLPTDAEIAQAVKDMEVLTPESRAMAMQNLNQIQSRETIKSAVEFLRNDPDANIYPTEAVAWPLPTLMRYHLFLQAEEKLNEYDYVFYLDADMRVVDVVGEEILGQGLTMAEHPMYALRPEHIPPYEPNKDSTAYIKRFGAVIVDEKGRPRFKPLYAAGGFQGGVTSEFVKAMKVMRKNIDQDFSSNYVAIWNDESHWNKYLSDYEGHYIALTPSYVYPDSLINEYYVRIWGKNYQPKIVTLTKKFTVTKEGGDELRDRLNSM